MFHVHALSVEGCGDSFTIILTRPYVSQSRSIMVVLFGYQPWEAKCLTAPGALLVWKLSHDKIALQQSI